MRSPLPALQAFAHDARALASMEDERAERLTTWLAVAKAAERLCVLGESERDAYLAEIPATLLPETEQRPTQVHDAKPAPTDALGRLAERLRLEAEQMERSGCFELAFTTVASVCRLVAHGGSVPRLTATVQLGRIARQLGDLDSAADCYQQVTEVALHERDGPLAAFGFIGLGNLARNRGNRPLERSLFERALTLAHPGGRVEAMASQGLMNVAISENRPIDALLHGWRAYDLASDESETRAMILSNLALVSLQADFAEAALRGFLHALSLTDVPRIQLPTISGAIRAAARLREHRRVHQLNAEGEAAAERARMPFESARFLLYAGEAWTTVGDIAFARRRYADAIAIAREYGFHEVVLRAEEALDRLDRAETPPSRPNLTSASVSHDPAGRAVAAAGIARMEALRV
jgi:tetratricopeptide (TPR) repeat protein